MTRILRRIRRRIRLPILFYAHPFELVLGFLLVLSGIRALIDGDTTPSVNAALPPSILVAFQTMSFLAGLGIMSGLILRTYATGRMLERAGLWLAVSAYGGYGIVLAGTYPMSLIWANFTTAVGIALAFGLRARALRRSELVILKVLRNSTDADASEVMRQLIDSRASDTEDGE